MSRSACMQEASQLWEEHYAAHAGEYAAVAFLRPDVHYHDPFPTHLIPTLKVRLRSAPLSRGGGGRGHDPNHTCLSTRSECSPQQPLETPATGPLEA